MTGTVPRSVSASRWAWSIWILLGMSVALAALPARVAVSPVKITSTPAIFNYHAVPAFTNLTFERPTVLLTAPGETNRLFVADHTGRIWQITNLAAPTKTLFIDLRDRVFEDNEGGLQAMVFHPQFATNGQFFIAYMGAVITANTTNLFDRISRFSVRSDDSTQGDPASEARLIDQFDRDRDHTLGDLHFGPDGYLYVSLGDEGGGNDQFENGQRVDHNFFGGLLRLDVDLRPGNLEPNPHPAVGRGTYLVPSDNPWVGAHEFRGNPVDPLKVRTEFFAVGLRNPWRFGFDPQTGDLYTNDTGDHTRDEVNLVVKGGNFGYPIMEGTVEGPRPTLGPLGKDLLPPFAEYGRQDGGSITAGLFYRGSKYPELDGNWLISDYWDGFLGLIHAQDKGTQHPIEWFAYDGWASSFGIDPSTGDILMANFEDSTIHRLVLGSAPDLTPLPLTLADIGAFTNVSELIPAEGLVPYEVNVQFWSDGAIKRRWFALPKAEDGFYYDEDKPWWYPPGTVFVKHFDLEMTNGVAESRRRIETRFLVLSESEIVQGFTYRWDESQTNATLVPPAGFDETFTIHDGATVRTQQWRYPSRRDCFSCHHVTAGGIQGFVTAQLNCEIVSEGRSVNQLTALAEGKYLFDLPASTTRLPVLANATNTAWSREWRARSFLAVNCGPCHRPDGIAKVPWLADLGSMLAQASLIGDFPVNNWGDSTNLVVNPGSAEHSMLFLRLASLARGHMPPLATSVINEEGAALVHDWITQDTAKFTTYPGWLTNAIAGASPQSPPYRRGDDLDGDGASNEYEWLAGTSPVAPNLDLKPRVWFENGQLEIAFHRLANRDYDLQWTAQLERTNSWRSLDHPENRFFLRAEDSEAKIVIPNTDQSRFFRLTLKEH